MYNAGVVHSCKFLLAPAVEKTVLEFVLKLCADFSVQIFFHRSRTAIFSNSQVISFFLSLSRSHFTLSPSLSHSVCLCLSSPIFLYASSFPLLHQTNLRFDFFVAS
jgi:hypothetical protein